MSFYLKIDDEKLEIRRDVCHRHDARIHEALGTTSEVELQACLDQFNEDDWFDGDEYNGEDCNGLGVCRKIKRR